MLSNASLDIAMHDKFLLIFKTIAAGHVEIHTFTLTSVILSPSKPTITHLAAFTVGLIDGDGAIQVNQWRGKILQYRIVVKLADQSFNRQMLSQIASVYGGYVRNVKTSRGHFVQWVINDSETIRSKIFPLFEIIPPLTTRLHLQLCFIKRAMQGISVKEYLTLRKEKYNTRNSLTHIFISSSIPHYFPSWVSGFIEAEGSFSVRSGAVGFSFSVSQTNDFYLIEAIRNFFNQNHLKVQIKKGTNMPLYLFEMYNQKGIETLVEHCLTYPLLGHKYFQLAQVIDKSIALAQLRKRFWT